MKQTDQATDISTIETTAAAVPLHPAAEKLCGRLDDIATEALHGDLRKATSDLALEFAAYLRTPD